MTIDTTAIDASKKKTAAAPQAKKRRRSPASASGASGASGAAAAAAGGGDAGGGAGAGAGARPRKKKTTATTKPSVTSTPTTALPPTHTLIIDNGGNALKYGWATDEEPKHLPNVTARLAHQITVLVGDELSRVQNPNSLMARTRSLERGLICNMSNQIQVWKRLLDLQGVSIPLQSEAATALGWKVAAARSKAGHDTPPKTTPSHSVAVILLVPPHCPRLLLDQILYVWMEDFGVSHVGFGNSTICASEEHETYKTSCTVDLGWSTSLIVPTFKGKAILPGAIRRLPIGGRHLISMLKYYMSYRQYNLMDQEHLLRDILEKLLYVSLDVSKELQLARNRPSGRRPYDRDYILPDYQTTHQGEIRLPLALQKELQRNKDKEEQTKEDDEEEDEDDDEDEDFEAEDDDEDDEDASGDDDIEKRGKKREAMEEDEDEEEESMEQRRKRLLQQRAEEERRRREQAEEEQSLRVSVERFVVPEVLFHPLDAGLPADLVGLAPAIVQAIQACPAHFQPALYQSVHLVGGLSQIPNLKTRLEEELRALAPSDLELKITAAESPIDQAWKGAKQWIAKDPYTKWSISRVEWESADKRKAYGRLLVSGGGVCV